ncbi:hypothetical protein B0619_07775 [Campylobacter lari]|nr:hypothetical protein [Campylobacter lari]EAI7269829.1 hypothetical protein [Campylobacter lari]EAK5787094.1 hypothetical protein [Campylobacter lari]EAK9878342.1 hypothetical protein [Campylobacter lari]
MKENEDIKLLMDKYEKLYFSMIVICEHIKRLEEKNKSFFHKFNFSKKKDIFDELKKYGLIQKKNSFNFRLNED